MKLIDTNLSYELVGQIGDIVFWAHWWYDRGMRKRIYMPLEFNWCKRIKK